MTVATRNQLSYAQFLESTRFKFVWNMAVVIAIMLGAVTLINLSNPNYYFLPVLTGASMGLVGLIYMKVTDDYLLVSRFFAIGSFVIISLTFLTLRDTIHYTTPMWMVISILYTFFTLGSLWGIITISLYMIVMVYFFRYYFSDNMQAVLPFNEIDKFTFTFEFLICGFIMGYILFLFIKTNRYAQIELESINETLNKQNTLIVRQNQDKDVMLKEIHHRVKNNLQVITSLLRLQSSKNNNEGGFTESINRVSAMALIHEKMYQNENITNFNLEEYIHALGNNLIYNYAIGIPIELKIESDFNNIHPKTIVPLALLLNELISNSLKHAFESKGQGTIHIHIYSTGNDKFHFDYSDDGKWKESERQSFGLEIIQAMTEQLDGQIEQDRNEKGTFYFFLLTNEKDKKESEFSQ